MGIRKNVEEKIQVKLLSDLIWGEEFGRPDWITPMSEWEDIYVKYSDNILVAKRHTRDFKGEIYEKVVGLIIIAFPKSDLVITEAAIIDNEWILSWPENWSTNSNCCYLSEIIIHPDYRGTDVLRELLDKYNDYLRKRKISVFYATAVTTTGARVLDNFERTDLLAIKEEDRKVYRVKVSKRTTNEEV